MKFLHAADVHLDAQLRGLAVRDDAPLEPLQRATRNAFQNLVSLALSERVDFVVLAGDLFDRDNNNADMRTWVHAKEQLQRLERESIPVYLIRGNHDFLGESGQRLSWPANVHEFRGDASETMRIDALNVALHGQSFAARAVPEDLAANYPERVDGCFNIGLLHTSLTGDADHDTYAPTSPDVLKLKGYDYWALGHIHSYQQVTEEPLIVYPGCTQGRHVNEPGAKGCVVVEVEESRPPRVTFHPLDVVRWGRVTVSLQPDDDREELFRRVEAELAALQGESSGRPLAVRVALEGSCECHHWLTSDAGREEAQAEIELLAHSLGDVWIERIEPRTTPPIDIARLRQGTDLLGELLRDIERLADGEDEELLTLAEPVLEPLLVKARSELGTSAAEELSQPDVIRSWLRQSEGLIADALGREGSA